MAAFSEAFGSADRIMHSNYILRPNELDRVNANHEVNNRSLTSQTETKTKAEPEARLELNHEENQQTFNAEILN